MVHEVVIGNPTFTSVSTSLNPSTYGQAVTFQVWVGASDPAVPAPTGTVRFSWDRFTIGSATVSGLPYGGAAVANFTTSTLNADTYPLAAVYSGDAENASSSSDVLSQVVLQATSAATLTSSPILRLRVRR